MHLSSVSTKTNGLNLMTKMCELAFLVIRQLASGCSGIAALLSHHLLSFSVTIFSCWLNLYLLSLFKLHQTTFNLMKNVRNIWIGDNLCSTFKKKKSKFNLFHFKDDFKSDSRQHSSINWLTTTWTYTVVTRPEEQRLHFSYI